METPSSTNPPKTWGEYLTGMDRLLASNAPSSTYGIDDGKASVERLRSVPVTITSGSVPTLHLGGSEPDAFPSEGFQEGELHLVTGGGRGTIVQDANWRDISPDPSKHPKEALPFLDPADRRLKGQLTIVKSTYSDLLLGQIIRVMRSQKNVKCLVPITDSIKHTSPSIGEDPPVHGSILSIYDFCYQIPINQHLPIGTQFKLSASNVATKTSKTDPYYSITILTDQLTPIGDIKLPKGEIPFNRRLYLFPLLPNEQLEGTFRVDYTTQFTILEMIHFERYENTLCLHTCLGRNPITLLKIIIDQLEESINDNMDPAFPEALSRSGYTEADYKPIMAYLAAAFKEVRSLKE